MFIVVRETIESKISEIYHFNYHRGWYTGELQGGVYSSFDNCPRYIVQIFKLFCLLSIIIVPFWFAHVCTVPNYVCLNILTRNVILFKSIMPPPSKIAFKLP